MKKLFNIVFDLQLFAGAPNTQVTTSVGMTGEMKTYYSDYLIDLGPEGGSGGGRIIAVGTPEEVAAAEDSYTGQYLKRVL